MIYFIRLVICCCCFSVFFLIIFVVLFFFLLVVCYCIYVETKRNDLFCLLGKNGLFGNDLKKEICSSSFNPNIMITLIFWTVIEFDNHQWICFKPGGNDGHHTIWLLSIVEELLNNYLMFYLILMMQNNKTNKFIDIILFMTLWTGEPFPSRH